MSSISNKRLPARVITHGTSTDFCNALNDEMRRLYGLALLLTGDGRRAEVCFISGMDGGMDDAEVKGWSLAWTQRGILSEAIRLMSPTPPSRNRARAASVSNQPPARSGEFAEALLQLSLFDRFVYVSSVVERYADRECSILLDCGVEDIVLARQRALRQLAVADSRRTVTRRTSPAMPETTALGVHANVG